MAIWPMPGRKQDRNAKVIVAGHAFVQNVGRGHFELLAEGPATRRLAVALEELAHSPPYKDPRDEDLGRRLGPLQ